MLIKPVLLRRALLCAQLAALSSCSTDEERVLTFGTGANGSGSASNLSTGGSNHQGGADSSDAGEAPSDSGANGANGGRSGTSAGSSSAGAPEQDGGAPPSMTGGGSMGGTSAGGSGHGGSGAVGGSSPDGGSSVSAGTSSGGTSSAGTGSGGTSSAGTGPDVDAGPCGDLDADGVQDCDETVALNPRFDQDAKEWIADYGVTQAWQSDDARSKPGSGSIKVTFTTAVGAPSSWALAAAGQCVPAWSEEVYEVGARARVANGQAGGNAQLSLAFFGNDGCAASFLSTATVESTATAGTWTPMHSSVKAPAGTRSVLVRLAAAKLGSQPSLEVHFDDVLFRKK